jgi:hypothetical protein
MAYSIEEARQKRRERRTRQVNPSIVYEQQILPVNDGAIPKGQMGVVTGCKWLHWPFVAANAIALAGQGISFAVADHGLLEWQRCELKRVGVQWIEHDRPENTHATHRPGIISDRNAWWKPFVCAASPFQVSAWIDADAVVVGPIDELLSSSPAVSTQHRFMEDGERLYRKLTSHLFGDDALPLLSRVQAINSGVLSWKQGDGLIEDWQRWCQRLLDDPKSLPMCSVRDQSAMVMMLVERAIDGIAWPCLLEDGWNWPADGLTMQHTRHRKPVSSDPAELLETAIERHPEAKIVHWLGRVKPWGRCRNGWPIGMSDRPCERRV